MPRPSTKTAAPLIPSRPTLPRLRDAAANCHACPLWERAKQTVFGEGKARSKVMMVGEQPGFQEDVAGRPFVGPAGRMLDDALQEAGIARNDVYVTNVVKHFKWSEQGKRHMHETPNASEIAACLPWLLAEIEEIKPQVLVCLGATAAKALLGRQFRVTKQRGQLIESPLARYVLATVHPSSLLRAPDEETRRVETARFIEDLKRVATVIRSL